MNENEIRSLCEHIFDVTKDSKGARIAAKTFINKASQEEARKFIEYLDTSDLAIRKISRYIIGQMGCAFALEPLLTSLRESIGEITFLPDKDYKEAHYFSNIIDILETLFGIIKINAIKDDSLRQQLIDIFNKTKHEDLRFSLIKLIALLGESGQMFVSLFDDLSQKERRALYYVYSFLDSPEKMKLFKKGLGDSNNHEFVVTNLMAFHEGRQELIRIIPKMSDQQKVHFLTILLENKHPEFFNILVELLDDDSRQVIQLATDNIISCNIAPFPLDLFLNKLKNGYSFEMVKAVLSIFINYVSQKIEEYLLDAMVIQPLFNNKGAILEAILKILKNKPRTEKDFSKRILRILLEYFKSYSEDRIDFMLGILKVIPGLSYGHSVQVREVKKELLIFLKTHEKQLNQTLINNMQDCIAKLNQIAARFDEAEEKVKHIEVLFNIDITAIESSRLEKLRMQLTEIEHLDSDFHLKFNQFLMKVMEDSLDWKVRSGAIELLADYGLPEFIPKILSRQSTDQSLGVRVSAEKAVASLQKRYEIGTLYAMVIEPLFYISKLIGDALTEKHYKVINYNDWPDPLKWEEHPYKLIWLSVGFFEAEWLLRHNYIVKYLDDHPCKVIIITANPELFCQLQDISCLEFLKKPFAKDQLSKIIDNTV